MNQRDKSDYELLKVCIEVGHDKWNGNTPNWMVVGQRLGFSNNKVRKQYNRIVKRAERDGIGINDLLHRFDSETFYGNQVVNEVVADEPSLVAQMITNLGLDPDLYEMESGKAWGSVQNPMISGTFTKKMPEAEAFEDLMARVDSIISNPTKVSVTPVDGNIMAMFSLYDAHLSKLHIDGTGMEQTTKAYKMVLGKLVAKVIRYGGAKRANFVIGQDFAHANIHSTTTAGTPQDVSAPFKIAVDQQIEVALESIELLRSNFEEVEIIIVRGNHSEESSYWMGSLIDAVYKNVPNVTVDNSHASRKATRWGNNGFYLLHGDKIKPARRPLLFATEYPEIFTQCENRTVFSGHLHSRRTDVNMLSEEYGIVQRQMSSLSDSDAWHEKSGYVLNKRIGSVLLYDSETGLDAEFYYTVK